jgi:hypothetical protein
MAATTDAQFAKAVAFAKTHANFVFAVSQLDGVKLEDVVRASMHAWIRDETDPNYDEQMDFKGKLSRAVIPLMGVKTAQQHKDEEAAARRAARALKPAAKKKPPPPLREKSARIEKAEKDRAAALAAAAEQAAKDEPPIKAKPAKKKDEPPIKAKPAKKKRKTPEDGPRDQRPSEMPPAKRAEHERVKAETKAKEDATGAVELEAAASAFKRTLAEKAWTPAKKAKYVAVVGKVKDWADRGGTKATAALWIRRLMSEGKDRLTPSVVRGTYKKIPPFAA